jgi:hypothetical protein
VYEFIVNVHNHKQTDNLLLHLGDIKMDGVTVNSSQLTMNVEPNVECASNTTDACTVDVPGYNDESGATTWSEWDNTGYQIGDTIFTITSSTKVNQFTLIYEKPIYAPGWIIRENGDAVLIEEKNRGDGETTSASYTYDLQ